MPIEEKERVIINHTSDADASNTVANIFLILIAFILLAAVVFFAAISMPQFSSVQPPSVYQSDTSTIERQIVVPTPTETSTTTINTQPAQEPVVPPANTEE